MSEYIYGTDGHEGHWLTGEEIVRCRDCRLVEEGRGIYAGAWFCHHFSTTDRAGFPVRPSGFCAWGERRVDA